MPNLSTMYPFCESLCGWLWPLLLTMQVVQAYTDAYGRSTSMIITPTVVKETQAQVRLMLRLHTCLQRLCVEGMCWLAAHQLQAKCGRIMTATAAKKRDGGAACLLVLSLAVCVCVPRCLQFGCDRVPGAALENEGGQGSAMAHWEYRWFQVRTAAACLPLYWRLYDL